MPSVLTQLQTDVATALKAGDRERARALRLVVSELQRAEKEGGPDEQSVLRRERKRRLDAAEQFRGAGRDELAAAEQSEAELIKAYLPAELSDEELAFIVRKAIEESGASTPRDLGKAMGVAMQWVDGRADGRRVSAEVRQALGA